MWRYNAEILKKDEILGANVFVTLVRQVPSVKADSVVDYLRSYPSALRSFLEFLVGSKIAEEAAFVDDELAVLYIKEMKASDPQRTSPAHRMTVNRLRSLLRTSKKLDLKMLLNFLDSQRFPHEYAIVCGRLGQHPEAIDIFINRLQDFDAAEEYCACVDDPNAWNALLVACVHNSYSDRMVDLMRRRPDQFEVASSLAQLPDQTKLHVIAPYLNYALRDSLHDRRMKKVHTARTISTIYSTE